MGNGGQVSEGDRKSNKYIEEVLRSNNIKKSLLIYEE
jgi:hypothetical protein